MLKLEVATKKMNEVKNLIAQDLREIEKLERFKILTKALVDPSKNLSSQRDCLTRTSLSRISYEERFLCFIKEGNNPINLGSETRALIKRNRPNAVLSKFI